MPRLKAYRAYERRIWKRMLEDIWMGEQDDCRGQSHEPLTCPIKEPYVYLVCERGVGYSRGERVSVARSG